MEKKKIESLNIITHLLGAIIGVFFLFYTIYHRQEYSTPLFIGLIIYTISFTILFLSSSIYHTSLALQSKSKKYLRILDHSAIYIFIAGSYTPFLVYLYQGKYRIFFLSIIWGLALLGILYKFITYNKYDKYKKLSTILYIAMGWISIIFIQRIYRAFGFLWIIFFFLGGVAYSAGTYFYRSNKNIYNHVIWHLFVLLGASFQLIPIFSVIMKGA
ncbi:MAG: hemolysin III family protein [Tissierellia bacterium]|nr:hemolysin III family protein [Tissierellia bacterium]